MVQIVLAGGVGVGSGAQMKFTSLCRHAGIGANSYLLECGGARVVFDAGMHPKHEAEEAIPHYEMVEEGSLDAVVVTHAHLDHVGTLPVLMRNQPQARVFLSPETAALGKAMLHNSVNVMQSKRVELGIAEYPLFNHADLDLIERMFETRNPERWFDLDEAGVLRAMFHDAGHILGSVGVTIEAEGKRLFYTGDVNFEPTTIQKGAAFPEGPVDAMILETTRGAQDRRADYTRRVEEDELAASIARVLARGGSVLIPVFAIGKTQEVLGMLHRFKKEGLVPKKTPVYIGGLSTKMTFLYDKFSDTSRRQLEGFRFLQDMDIETGSRKRRGPIPFHNGCIYALSSGMMSEKTVSNQFARLGVLENPKHGLFFVGYADPETPGGKIRAAQHGDLVSLDAALAPVQLKCEMRAFDFSGHAPREHLVDFVGRVMPKKVFLVHGDDDAVAWFKAEIESRYKGIEAVVPQPGEVHEI
jgi:Cft2 family RNA processing exonuclease